MLENTVRKKAVTIMRGLLHRQVKTSDDVIVMFVDVVKRLTKEKVAEKVLKENPLDPAATVAKSKVLDTYA